MKGGQRPQVLGHHIRGALVGSHEDAPFRGPRSLLRQPHGIRRFLLAQRLPEVGFEARRRRRRNAEALRRGLAGQDVDGNRNFAASAADGKRNFASIIHQHKRPAGGQKLRERLVDGCVTPHQNDSCELYCSNRRHLLADAGTRKLASQALFSIQAEQLC